MGGRAAREREARTRKPTCGHLEVVWSRSALLGGEGLKKLGGQEAGCVVGKESGLFGDDSWEWTNGWKS